MDKPFQRRGTESNSFVGREFEACAQVFFERQGLLLTPGITVEIGINGKKKHKFDLGCVKKKVLVECKSHTWTEGGNVPSAKMTTWDQAMFYFHISPEEYRKVLFVLKDFSVKRNETLAEYYVRTSKHLIPRSVEVWEYDQAHQQAVKIWR